SVDKFLFDDPLAFAYRVREKVEFQAHGRAYLGPFAREPATSWAAPHLAGVAAKLLSLKPDLKPFELKTLLYWMFRTANSPSAFTSSRLPRHGKTEFDPTHDFGRPGPALRRYALARPRSGARHAPFVPTVRRRVRGPPRPRVHRDRQRRRPDRRRRRRR